MDASKGCFTLAEVLLTLVIVGIVAALTIPSLMNSTQETQYKTAYRESFSRATQAWARALQDDKISTRSWWCDGTGNKNNFNACKTYFNVRKNCGDNNASGCWDLSGEKFFGGHPGNNNYPSFIASGAAWASDGCGLLMLDINNFNGPNKHGRDRFSVYVCRDINVCTAASTELPTYIDPLGDEISVNNDTCLSGNCFYTSWLTR